MRVKQVLLKDIIVQDRFRKDYGDIDSLKESISLKGLIQPITIDQDNYLVAGGRRFEACSQLGMDKISCVVRKSLGAIDNLEVELLENINRKELNWLERANLERKIFDLNQERDQDWSLRKQASLMGCSHGSVDRRINLSLAVEQIPELADLPNEDQAWKALQRIREDAARLYLRKQAQDMQAQERKARIDAGEEVEEEWVSEEGEEETLFPSEEKKKDVGTFINKYAANWYIIRDALEGLQKLSPGTCHFAEVDPPYGIDLDKTKRVVEPIKRYTEIPRSEYPDFLANLSKEVYRVLDDHAFCVWWFGIEWYQTVVDTLEVAGFSVNKIPAIWDKELSGQNNAPDVNLANCYETFLVARKGTPKLAKPGRNNKFTFRPVSHGKKIHPTEKPIELMEEILEVFAYPLSRVVVPFLGSGVTIRAAARLDMRAFGFDLDPILKERFLAALTQDVLEGRAKRMSI